MRTNPDPRMRALIDKSQQAHALMEDGQHAEAVPLLREVLAEARRLRVPSPWAQWACAVALDLSGDAFGAYMQVQNTVLEDLLNESHGRTYDIIANRLRRRVLEATDDEPQLPRWFEALQRAGDADVDCCLRWARFLGSHGREVEAKALVDAVVLLAPASMNALQLGAALARKAGDEGRAELLEDQALALVGRPAAYDLPAEGDKS